MDAFYTIYNYSKILAVDVHLEVVNLDTAPYELVMGTCQQGLISTISVDQAKQSPGAITKIVSGSAGMNRAIIRKHFNTEQIVGYHLADRDTRMTLSDANSGSYADSSLPAIFFFPSLITGSSTNGMSITALVTYHVCFFDLKVPAVTAVKTSAERNGLWPPEPDPPVLDQHSFEQLVIEEEQSRDELRHRVATAKRPLDINSKPWVKR
jgi:hypothetical protein